MFIECRFNYRDVVGNIKELKGYVLNSNSKGNHPFDRWMWSDLKTTYRFIENSNGIDRYFQYSLVEEYLNTEVFPQGKHRRSIWNIGTTNRESNISTSFPDDIRLDWSKLVPKWGEPLGDKPPILIAYEQKGPYLLPIQRLEEYDKEELKEVLNLQPFMNIPAYINVGKNSELESYIKRLVGKDTEGDLSIEWSIESRHEFI